MANILPTALYSSQQLYAMEQAWFAQGYDSFALMQQAAWQMTQKIIHLEEENYQQVISSALTGANICTNSNRVQRASVWVGHGNNGGDGWLIAHYLQQAGWQVQVVTVGINILDKNAQTQTITDAQKAQQIALNASVLHQQFADNSHDHNANVFVDALFGIGLDRKPTGIYKQAIETFNRAADNNLYNSLVVAVDIPSGLQASTGQVFDNLAIQADITLCLIARKFGLHTKDGMDYAGTIIDVPLIPYLAVTPFATLLNTPQRLPVRRQNSHKGSYGHVLVIGGNQVNGSQGMGGAAILAATSAMVMGAGKITVACHNAFHGALITALPDAMTIDLHDQDGVIALIKEASIVAIGMGLGRDKKAKALFISYLQATMQQGHALIIDADGLYHLASLQADGDKLVNQLRGYAKTHRVCLTPHSGEAARLLNKQVVEIENDRLAAIKQCAEIYGGDWVLKGAGSLVLEQGEAYICAVGNAGMATAGMGDVLSGVATGLLAQQDLADQPRNLCQAVLIHGLAGDWLTKESSHLVKNKGNTNAKANNQYLIGQRSLQAQDMPVAIDQIMQLITR